MHTLYAVVAEATIVEPCGARSGQSGDIAADPPSPPPAHLPEAVDRDRIVALGQAR